MTIGRILYRDPYFLLQDDYTSSKLLPHEAYGYISENDKDLIVHFIRNENEDGMVKGIIVPKGALDSKVEESNNEIFKEFRQKKIRILWRDVVYVANTERTESTVLQTDGIFVDIHCNSVVIRSPKTKRISPASEAPYPKDVQPVYFVIPISLVEKMDI